MAVGTKDQETQSSLVTASPQTSVSLRVNQALALTVPKTI